MIRFVSILILLAGALQAQSQPPLIATRILTYAPAGLPASFVTYYKTKQAVQMFRSSAGSLGLPIEYLGPQTFALYGSKTDLDPPPPGKLPVPPIATVLLPAKADNILIVCTRDANGKVGLFAYDISSADLKPGNYRVFNFAKSQVSVILGDQRFALTPGKDIMVRDPKWHTAPLALPLSVAIVVDRKPKPVFSSYWEHYPLRRTLLFLFDGRHPAQPISFVDFDATFPTPIKAETKN